MTAHNFLNVREGDTVTLTVKRDEWGNLRIHAATNLGTITCGAATPLMVTPTERRDFHRHGTLEHEHEADEIGHVHPMLTEIPADPFV